MSAFFESISKPWNMSPGLEMLSALLEQRAELPPRIPLQCHLELISLRSDVRGREPRGRAARLQFLNGPMGRV